ncbi:MAG TPA: hypothetical protein DEG70_15570 [Chloroflexi bacterium]|nr:hypothetical protein [Chloroflexota bacterium]
MPKRAITGGVVGVFFLGVAVWAYARHVAPRWLEAVRLRVAVPALPSDWEGVRIAHLTDFHAGGRGVRLDMLWRARRIAEAFGPDIIALTGDFYDRGRPVPDGGLFVGWPDSAVVVGVLGNHDNRGSAEDQKTLRERLAAGGVHVLKNDAVVIPLRERCAWIVGVDDPFTFRADITTAITAMPSNAEALLLLAHSPAIANDLPIGRARLVFSGHTHGGQIRVLPSGRVPFAGMLRRMAHEPPGNDPVFYRGVRWLRGSLVVVSNGLGMSELPLRFLTRPQVVLIEIVRGPENGASCDEAARYVTRLDPPSRLLRWLS